jgi:hypothetical protein
MMKNFDAYVLGETQRSLSLESWEENRLAACALARQARRTLHIFTRDLEPRVYDNEEFTNVLISLARSYRHSKVMILLQDSERVVKNGHQVLNLAQRLSSYIEIRKPIGEYALSACAYLIVDQIGVLRRELATHYAGTVNFSSPRYAVELSEAFQEAWEHGQPDPNCRRLHL